MPRSAVTLPSLKKSGIAGIPELRAQLAQVIDKASAEGLKDVFFEAGMVLYERLHSDISTHSPSKGNKAFPAGALLRGLFITRGKPGKPNVMVGISGRDGANYLGIWLEHGTYKQSPQPFFRPAVLAARPEMAQIIATGIKDAVDEATQ